MRAVGRLKMRSTAVGASGTGAAVRTATATAGVAAVTLTLLATRTHAFAFNIGNINVRHGHQHQQQQQGDHESPCFFGGTKVSSTAAFSLWKGATTSTTMMSTAADSTAFSPKKQRAAPGLPEPGPGWLVEERDACGVGFIANPKGKSEHKVVKHGLAALGCMEHRGACLADNV